jgi:hypothetical protein
MMPRAQALQAAAAEWHETQRVCAIYRGIARRFALPEIPCKELETPPEKVTPEAWAAIRGWLQNMDERIQVHHLRLFLQTSTLSNEANVRSLIRHHLNKPSRATADRDKLDFLLVQDFSQSAPTELVLHSRPAFTDVAKVLEPVLGHVPGQLPPRLQPLEPVLDRLNRCANLRGLLQSGVLTEVRRLKDAAGDDSFAVSELIAFSRANFLIRQTFFRLVQADLDMIRLGVRQLEKDGVETIDCTRARLTAAEPMARVLELAQQWKKPFQAEYSAGNPFVQLAELRAAVEDALDKHGQADPTAMVPPAEPAAKSGSAAEETTAQPAPVSPQVSTSNPPASNPGDASAKLQMVSEQLSAYLLADRVRSRTMGATIVVGNARLVISSWEVTSFLDSARQFSRIVQRAVAVRVLMFQLLEQLRQGGSPRKLAPVVALVRNEAADLQQFVGTARRAHDIEATVALSAAAQQLANMLREAESLTRIV